MFVYVAIMFGRHYVMFGSFGSPRYSSLKMVDRLTSALIEIGLSELIANFCNEKIDDEMVSNLNDTELNRLGLNTIVDRHRFREKLRTDTAMCILDDGQDEFGRPTLHSQV
ncbi:hypothetical protein DPMN_013387 [Dreissena polymorpha]|uniref:SAM domain-containing protein n=1 Tax=Dreissena polymorpha TaxID=45954 RepID=A0A9D4S3Q9_DREPO|nr:hypothetical protein DPMN_013387 [Dreissena polymorpha]